MTVRLPSLIVGAMALSASATALCATVPTSPIVVSARHATFDQNEMVVPYNDLALSAPAGQKALVHRVSQAIDSLCDNSSSWVTDPVFSLKCHRDAWTRVEPQLAQVMPAR